MKKAQVIWSDQALNDLETIYDFLRSQSREGAQRIIEGILSRSRQLEAFPESGARQEQHATGANNYRYLVEGSYKIVYSYRSESKAVHVVTIFDTRINPDNLKV